MIHDLKKLVFVAAGSNLQPEANLQRAVRELQAAFNGVHFSPAYRNAAVGFVGEDFINFVLKFSTKLSVHAVIEHLQRIERLCGRERQAPKWEPRSMDLDILLYGNLICDEAGLVLPRPDLLRHSYMLGPMAALAPDLQHPVLHLSMQDLWQRFDRAAHPLQEVSFF
ncbi:MAG: 2-amino-4-hydroxy-6-hydroxymethyldihydropteridine diphosphokinase [Gammaproteobacteria bacterium]|nr:2-amino-4-hydroxy-6-hydroxymethyldihydropteridine diphosphokinase [Gammaproteobacteria bacterium]